MKALYVLHPATAQRTNFMSLFAGVHIQDLSDANLEHTRQWLQRVADPQDVLHGFFGA